MLLPVTLTALGMKGEIPSYTHRLPRFPGKGLQPSQSQFDVSATDMHGTADSSLEFM